MAKDQSHILVVDEEASFRQLCHDILSGAGYRVTPCTDGETAIDLLRRQSFDLVVVDLLTPGISGFDLLQHAADLPDPAPVITTADSSAAAELVSRALQGGARQHLAKPFHAEQLTHVVASCLQQQQLTSDNSSLQRQLQLCRTAQSLSSLIDIECLIPQSLKALMQELNADIGCSFLLSEDEVISLTGLEGLHVEQAHELVALLLPEYHSSTSLDQPRIVSSISLQKMMMNREQMWLLPLRDGEKLKGGLLVGNALVRPDATLPMAELLYLCDQITLGFANAARYQNAQQLMYLDDLTGLYNHRYLKAALHQEMMRSKRYGLKFSLMFLDLDRFKQINDQFGHLAGSAALREVAQLMRNCVRDVDTLFRFGGDEFAAMLVETDSRGARVVAERIRDLIERHTFLDELGAPCQVTITIGLATFPDDAGSQERLLDLADQAMYAGKELRNNICDVSEIIHLRR